MDTAQHRALEAVLRKIDAGLTLRRVTVLPGGISARVSALDVDHRHGAERWVLRVPPADEDLDGATEFALLRALHDAEFPVPEPLALIPADVDAGVARDATLARFVDHDVGVPVPTGGLDRMAACLADLHARGPTDSPTLPPWSPPPLPATLAAPDPGRVERLLAAARAAGLPDAREGRLCHRDLWPGNVLWRGGRLAAWLDWEEARVGDPLEDLAIARLELHWLMDTPRVERFLAAYGAHRGQALDRDALDAWTLRVALVRAGWLERWPMEPALLGHMHRIAIAVAERAAERLGVLSRNPRDPRDP